MQEQERRHKPDVIAPPSPAGAGGDPLAYAEQMRRLAYEDPLTGLLNRRGFDEELRRLWAAGEASAFPLGLLIVDIDHFKAINDSFGHFVGDQVLKECARLMQASVRGHDTVCRYYGGDEMVVLLPGADRDETRSVAERMLATFRENLICPGSYDLRMGISVGACSIPAAAEPTADRFLIMADRALYRAKQTGRNRLCFADEWPESQAPVNGHGVPLAPAGTADSRPTVLVVDDEPAFCEFARRTLARLEYNVRVAHSGAGAVAALRDSCGMIDVALVDLRLQDEDGLEVLKQLRQIDDTVIGVVITGVATVEDAVGALRLGVYDLIAKPLSPRQLAAGLERALKYRRLLLENKRYQAHLEEMVREKNAALSRALDNISDTYQFTLEAITDILDAREQQTGEHSRRVARMAVVLARELGAMPEEIQTIETGALLHDIGKIGVPDAILLKRSALTPDERALMDRHPHIGYNIIKAGPGLEEVSEIVLAHHERYNGSGYPRGLQGDGICFGARIFAVIDTYDAIRTDRPYSKGRSAAEALEEIHRHRGTLFDPAVVDAFQRRQAEIEKAGGWPVGLL